MVPRFSSVPCRSITRGRLCARTKYALFFLHRRCARWDRGSWAAAATMKIVAHRVHTRGLTARHVTRRASAHPSAGVPPSELCHRSRQLAPACSALRAHEVCTSKEFSTRRTRTFHTSLRALPSHVSTCRSVTPPASESSRRSVGVGYGFFTCGEGHPSSQYVNRHPCAWRAAREGPITEGVAQGSSCLT